MLDFDCFRIVVPDKERFKQLHDAVYVGKLLAEAKEAVAKAELVSPELKGLTTDELWKQKDKLAGANELRKLKERAAELEEGLIVVSQYGNVAAADPGVTVDTAGGVVSFQYVYKDCLEKFRTYRAQLSMCGVAQDKTTWMGSYATVEYLRLTTDLIDDCRDQYRDFDFPDLGDPGIDGTMEPNDAAKELFKGTQKGFCLGNSHDDQNSKDFLYDGIDSGDLMGAGGLLFIEEFKTWIQPDINDYLTTPNAEMSSALKKYVKDLNNNYHLAAPKDFEGILKKAKEKGLKVFGIDAGEADAGDCASSSFGERRTATMNKVAEDIMKQALKDNPGKEFIALVGKAHSNTHEGGIPGLSQIFGIPAVVLDDSNKLAVDPEDTSLRTMPDKASQHLIDRLGKQIDFSALSKNGVDSDSVRAGLVKLASEIAKATGVDSGGRPNISDKDLGKLIDKVVKEFPGKGLDAVKDDVKRGANSFVRDAEHVFLKKEVADGKKLNAKDLASLIVLEAENEAWRANREADEWAGIELNKKKHDKVITDLSKKLADIVDSPEKVKTAIAEMPKALATGDDDGEPLFHIKPAKTGGLLGIGKHTRDSDHISIEAKQVNRIWLAKLARLLDKN